MDTKVYVTGPTKGKDPWRIQQEREAVVEEIKIQLRINARLANPCRIDCGKGELWGLGRDLQLLAGCDEAFFRPGWEEDERCRIEKMACEYYHILSCELQGDEELIIIPGGQMHI